ncbi:MAG: NAD(P)H-hydrate dehydratase [Candidatus Thorarchaeota archaeon]
MQETAISTEEMRVTELNAQYLGVTLRMLMQNAGREVSREIVERENVAGKRIVILCGGGGNGGDGMVAARHLHEAGARVEVYLIGHERNMSSPDAVFNWNILKNLDGIVKSQLRSETAVRECNAIQEADILIDAMLGFGLHSPLREPTLSAVREFNKSPARKYSIDVPTGIDSDSGEVYGEAVRADVTITLHAPKPGLSRAASYAGEVIVVPIGIPPEASVICGDGDLWLFNKPRRAKSKKGDFGRILVVGGSNVYSGAPALTGLAALRTGADLVSVLAPQPVVPAIRSYSPTLMVTSLGTEILSEESVEVVLEMARKNDVVALGPGLGRAETTGRAVRTVVSSLSEDDHRMVIDADGLKLIAGSDVRLGAEQTVLTPHWGELSELMGRDIGDPHDMDNRIAMAVEAARTYNAVVLLKGPTDVISHPDGRYRLNKTGTPAMTVGGTGDVLTGITAALLARGKGAFRAAAAAAFISGKAGEAASAELGGRILPTDCIDRIPHVMSAHSITGIASRSSLANLLFTSLTGTQTMPRSG